MLVLCTRSLSGDRESYIEHVMRSNDALWRGGHILRKKDSQLVFRLVLSSGTQARESWHRVSHFLKLNR